MTTTMTTVTGIRVMSAVALFILTIIAGAVPPLVFALWRRRKRNNVLSITRHDSPKKKSKVFNYHNIMQILMFFGGGILLATCFCHLIPEVRENLDHYFQNQQLQAKNSDHNHHHHHHHHHHDHDDHHHEDDEIIDTTQPPTAVPLPLVNQDFSTNSKSNNSATLSSASNNINLKHADDHIHSNTDDDHDHTSSASTSTSSYHPHHDHHHQEPGNENHGDHYHDADHGTDKDERDDHEHEHDTPRTAALHGHPHPHHEADLEASGSDGHGSHSDSKDKESHSSHSHGLPYVELAVCGGFFVIYLLEELVHTFIGHQHDDQQEMKDQEEGKHHLYHQGQEPRSSTSFHLRSDEDDVESSSSSSGGDSPISYTPPSKHTIFSVTSSVDDLSPSTPRESEPVSIHSLANLAENKRMAFTNFAIDLKNEGNMIISHPSAPSMSPPETPESITSSTHGIIFATRSNIALVPAEETPSAYKVSQLVSKDKHLQPPSVRFLQGLVVIIAFSAHSIFDGVAIGLQEESSRIWTMFFAICSHKLVVALAVGMFNFRFSVIYRFWVHAFPRVHVVEG